jgi:hypothetical protein
MRENYSTIFNTGYKIRWQNSVFYIDISVFNSNRSPGERSSTTRCNDWFKVLFNAEMGEIIGGQSLG